MARQTIIVWGASGGVGTSVAATMLAHQHPGRVTLVDLAGDLNRVLALPDARHGVSDLSRPGVLDATETLHLTSMDISPRVSLVPFGDRHCPTARPFILADGPLADLAEWIRAHPHLVIVDAGVGPPPDALREVATDSLAVTRLTRVNTERLRRMRDKLTGLIVVEHPTHGYRAPTLPRSPQRPSTPRFPTRMTSRTPSTRACSCTASTTSLD